MRVGRYDRGPQHRAEWFSEVATIEDALKPFVNGKEVLEFACGTGRWTKQLAAWGAHVLAVDAAHEALLINRNSLLAPNVDYCQADVLGWRAERVFDVVFFSFWLSHILPQRFSTFWQIVRRSLKRNGCAFFIDSLFEQESTARDHPPVNKSGLVRRKLNDGREFRVVKVFYDPSVLEKRLIKDGWQGWVRSSGKFFLYGVMSPKD
jgi:demethylmenaquinone methyltransferase/2-methoxy-6-polyprenyl-1,4-benzoquinol methylase